MKKEAAVTCVGLAFTNSTTLVLVLRNDYAVKTFPADDWTPWLKKATKTKNRPVVAIVEETEHFESALTCGAQHVIVLAKLDWLTNRNITCLDAEESEGLPKVKRLSPEGLMRALKENAPYTTSTHDKWRKRGNPANRCAGCHLLEEAPCKGKKKPESKRCEKYDPKKPKAAYYNLSNLIYLALKHTNEDAMLITPKEVWRDTYDFAVGRMGKTEWVGNCGRKLRTAGTSKDKLKLIVEWVAKYGKALAAGKRKNPPGKLDLKLAQKRLAAKGKKS
jgi:hypothetical protein